MKKKSALLLILMLLMGFMLVGCDVEVSTFFNVNVTGKVDDSSTGRPLSGVRVSVSGVSTTTDSNGYYKINNVSISGSTKLVVEKAGYSTYAYTVNSYPDGGTLILDVALRKN